MKVVVQLAAESGPIPKPVEIDHTDWATLSGTVHSFCIQGMWFQRFDQYHVDDVGGRARVRCWRDVVGHSDGLEVVFAELAPDPAFGGELNTSIDLKVFAEGDAVAGWTGRISEVHAFRNWEKPSTGIRPDAGLTPTRFDEHSDAKPAVSWRDWIAT